VSYRCRLSSRAAGEGERRGGREDREGQRRRARGTHSKGVGGRTERGRARATHEGVGGRTERGRARATHLITRFHEGVEVRPCPVGWALSTELPQSLQFWSACFGPPHTLQVSPPVLDDALHHLCPSLLGKVAGARERLANSRRAQYFPEIRCSLSVRRRHFFDPERVGGLRDHGGGPRRLGLGIGDLHSRNTAEQEGRIDAQAVGRGHGVQCSRSLPFCREEYKHPVQPLEARQAALHHPISRQGRSTLSRAQHGAQNSPFAEHDGTNEGRRRRRCLAGWPDWCRRQLRIKITRTNCPQNGAPTLA
jgi:hypothetical protein